jgi:hypothetical protein
LSVSKGFFKRASALAVASAGEEARKGAGGALSATDDEMVEVGGAWGGEENLELDEDGEPIRKRRGGAGDDEDGAGDGEGGWDELEHAGDCPGGSSHPFPSLSNFLAVWIKKIINFFSMRQGRACNWRNHVYLS